MAGFWRQILAENMGVAQAAQPKPAINTITKKTRNLVLSEIILTFAADLCKSDE